MKANEPIDAAATRELKEESGINAFAPHPLGTALIGLPKLQWHFYRFEIAGLPERWSHRTEDDGGHVFEFFWHPLEQPPDATWHASFQVALKHITDMLSRAKEA